jgi:hypothetical protein
MSSGQAWCADPANAERLRAAEELDDRREMARGELLGLALRGNASDAEVLRAFRAYEASFRGKAGA